MVTEPELDVLEVLRAAADRGERMHGWEVVETVRRSGATVHRVLDQLEHAGRLVAEWDATASGRDRRRWYTLTPDGLAWAVEVLTRFRTSLNQRP